MNWWHKILRRYHQLMAQDYFGRASVTPQQIPFLDSHAPELLDYYLLHRHVHDYLPTKIVAYGVGTWATVLGWAVFRFRQDNMSMHLWIVETDPVKLKEYRSKMPQEFQAFTTLRNEWPAISNFNLWADQKKRFIQTRYDELFRTERFDATFDICIDAKLQKQMSVTRSLFRNR